MIQELLVSIVSTLGPNVLLWFWCIIVIYVWYSSRRRVWCRVVSVGLLMLIWCGGTKPVLNFLVNPLERQYEVPEIALLRDQRIQQIVVLTGGGYAMREGSLASAFPSASVYRFLGGLELCARLRLDCRIIFSGSAGRQKRDLATAESMKDLSLLLNPRCDVVAEARSGSTAEHPANVRPMLQSEPFLLVTSAVHMPRAMQMFKTAGISPIAYPVDFLRSEGPHGWRDFVPSAENLWKLGVALREYQALAFYGLMK